jgi:hypothetical protein
VYAAKSTGRSGNTRWTSSSRPGRYAYTVTDGFTDREYTYPPVRIVGSEPVVPVPSSGGEGSFPVWAPVVGGIALLLAAVGAGVYARRAASGCRTRQTLTGYDEGRLEPPFVNFGLVLGDRLVTRNTLPIASLRPTL